MLNEASNALLEVLIATCYMQRDAIGITRPMTNRYLFANLLLFASGGGDEATLSSFAICYTTIEASGLSLKVLIASLLLAGGLCERGHFPMAIRLLIAFRSLFAFVVM